MGIYLVSSTSNIISDNTCSGSDRGINLSSSSSNIVINNILTGNTAGVYLDLSNSNTVANNTCTSNSNGIYLNSSNSNTVSNNTSSNNNFGVYLWLLSDSNEIQWNIFLDNSINGFDSGTGNTFDYNYWSDYVGPDNNGDGIGDTSYTFTTNSDPHPLIYLPTLKWIEVPKDQSVEFEHLFYYELNVLSYSPIIYSISDTMRFTIDSQGIVESIWILPIDIYALQVNVTNIYRISITATFYLTVVVDAGNPPGWLMIPTDQYLSLGQKFDYQVIAIDPSGIDRWELNDTIHFTLSISHYSDGSTARFLNKSNLERGSYGLNISVYDVYGNRLSATFSVIVEADTTPTTTTTSTTTTGPTNSISGGIDPVMTFALGAGLGGAAVVVIVIVMLKRRVAGRSEAS
jgi:parallel beta-helix repeat protein